MASVFESLPGFEVPVNGINRMLADIWHTEPTEGSEAPSEFRASQMNLVIHFGMQASVEDAVGRFETAIRFAQRYPCRILLLCPVRERSGGLPAIRSKVFSECYIGRSRREMICCEVLVLEYSLEERAYVQNQVSVCLESDLPVYYWPHRFHSVHRIADYQDLLGRAKRVIVDSGVEPEELLAQPWYRKDNVRDLAAARMLPVRQSLGHFLSAYPPEALVAGLREVSVESTAAWKAEGRVLLDWLWACLLCCGLRTADHPEKRLAVAPPDAPRPVRACLRFDGENKYFCWEADFEQGDALLEADFGTGEVRIPTNTSLLTSEAALAEAIFF